MSAVSQDGQPLPRRHLYTLSKDIPPDCSLLDPRAQWPGPIALLKSLEKRRNHFRNVQYDIPPPPLQFNLKNQSQETCIFYVNTPRFQKQRKTAHNIILYPSCLSASAELKGGEKKILGSEHEHTAQEIECLLQRVFTRAVSGLISDML